MFAHNLGLAQAQPRAVIDVYKQHFAAYPGAFVAGKGEQIDQSGRVLLPQDCLREMANMNLVYPLQFEVRAYNGRSVCAGVLEFESERGKAILPRWMFQHLMLKEGETVLFKTVALPQGSLVKLRPHQRSFVEAIADPKVVLESHLKHHPVLTRGSTIVLSYLGREFSIDVLETLESSGKSVKAISTVRHDVQTTELKVEFARPLDMPDSPVKPPPEALAFPQQPPPQGVNVIGGQEGVQFVPLAFKPPTLLPDKSSSAAATPTDAVKPSFVPFGGGGRSLSGRPPPPNPSATQTPTSSAPSASSTPTTSQAPGNDAKFTAFQGSGRSLR